MERITVGPVTLSLIDERSLAVTLEGLLDRKVPTQLVTFNALMFNGALHDKSFAAMLSSAGAAVCDSVGIVWAVRLLTGKIVHRLPGIDLINYLCSIAGKKGSRLFLVGARAGVADEAAKHLAGLYPGLVIAGTHHGYFTDADEKDVLDSIRRARADIVLIGMAIPRQEQWIARNLGSMGASIAIGVGGSFDVLSGRLKRAPALMQRCGMEWLFRLHQQPSRIFRMAGLLCFVLAVLRMKLRGPDRLS
jgi:N-acetylglucosaminyldiphosphoundecaprenol N-acetyl-beta-D-mannosaminyltransferase